MLSFSTDKTLSVSLAKDGRFRDIKPVGLPIIFPLMEMDMEEFHLILIKKPFLIFSSAISFFMPVRVPYIIQPFGRY